MIKKIKSFVAAIRKISAKEFEQSYLQKKFPTVHFRNNVSIVQAKNFLPGQHLELAQNVVINCGGQEWSKGKGYFKCGDFCYIGPNSVIFAAGEIEMGHHVLLSPSVNLISHQHSYADGGKTYDMQESHFNKITIGNNVWIGAGATILPGVTIGNNAIVGANALVNKNVEANTIVAGVPARVIKILN